jgi:hypothetical protein
MPPFANSDARLFFSGGEFGFSFVLKSFKFGLEFLFRLFVHAVNEQNSIQVIRLVLDGT